eukprot:3985828-Amphidinium_carterae.1
MMIKTYCLIKTGAIPPSLCAPVAFLRRNLLEGSIPEGLLGSRKNYDRGSRDCIVANALAVLNVPHLSMLSEPSCQAIGTEKEKSPEISSVSDCLSWDG